MKLSSKRSRVLLAAVAVSAAVLLSGCEEETAGSTAAADAASTAASASVSQTVSTPAVQPSGATAEQTSELISSLTADEIQQLVSGTATLAQLEQQRFNLPGTTAAADASASTESAASSSAPAAASSTATAAAASSYDAELQDLLNQLYAVKAKAESGLNSAIAAAKSEYHALPKNQQTTAKKLSIVMSKSSELRSLQSSCDKEVNSIVEQMRAVLTKNGQSTELADQALAAYESQKASTYNTLKSQLMG